MKIVFVGASGYGNVGDDVYPNVLKSRLPGHELIFFNSDHRPLPSGVDMVVIGGGGLIHNVGGKAESESSPHLLRMAFYIHWATECGIPWGFLSCGLQFRPGGDADYMQSLKPWVPYLRGASFLSVRSPRCAAIIFELCGRNDILVAPDLAYLFTPMKAIEKNPRPEITLIPAGLINPRNRFTQHSLRLLTSIDHKIVWLSMGSKSDDEVNLQYARTLYPDSTVIAQSTPDGAYSQIARSALVFSGRYHGMVFARLCSVPFLVPEEAPYKLTSEDFLRPIQHAENHIELLRSQLRE